MIAYMRYIDTRKKEKMVKQVIRLLMNRLPEGRAILLINNYHCCVLSKLTSNIAAFTSFGIEAGLGVASAFLLTGLWPSS